MEIPLVHLFKWKILASSLAPLLLSCCKVANPIGFYLQNISKMYKLHCHLLVPATIFPHLDDDSGHPASGLVPQCFFATFISENNLLAMSFSFGDHVTSKLKPSCGFPSHSEDKKAWAAPDNLSDSLSAMLVSLQFLEYWIGQDSQDSPLSTFAHGISPPRTPSWIANSSLSYHIPFRALSQCHRIQRGLSWPYIQKNNLANSAVSIPFDFPPQQLSLPDMYFCFV